jgi:hypothetical protein
VLVCHAPYLDRLPAAIDSIQAQSSPADLAILSLDGCHYDAPGWHTLTGTYHSPNPARNAGWQHADQHGCQWVIFWDADNTMPPGYIWQARQRIKQVESKVGIISPDVLRTSAAGTVASFHRQPETRDYWTGRAASRSDTSSVWRIEALQQAGGFTVGNAMLDDYLLAARITRLGWTVESLNTAVMLTGGDTRSSSTSNPDRGIDGLWCKRHFHIITLLSGRHAILRDWSTAIHNMDLPPHTSITLVNDSHCTRFARDVQAEAASLLHLPHVRSVRVIEMPEGQDVQDWREIHRRVAMLYNTALHGDTHDMILLWEDDVIPPPHAFKTLHRGFTPFSKLGAVGAVYASRRDPTYAVASTHKEHWKRDLKIHTLPPFRVPVGMLGGGFTLWAGHALIPLLPLHTSTRLGWDGNLSRAATQHGWRMELDGTIHANHLT